MKNKINVAELLKDCPKGMELNCLTFDNIFFQELDWSMAYPIICYRKNNDDTKENIYLTEFGSHFKDNGAKCIIFPKGKTTWEGFVPPCKFKDGDIVTTTLGNIAIIRKYAGEELFYIYGIMVDNNFYKDEVSKVCVKRLATEEEKQKLFQAIKNNDYKGNAETKTLEKLPKFKVGDRIRHKSTKLYCTLGEYSEGISAYRTNIGLSITHKDLEQWELAPNKFDITNLIPFESKVLVRDMAGDMGGDATWYPAIWGCTGIPNIDTYPYIVLGGVGFEQCIPYEGNEHLRGTTNDCDEYYKIWE